LIVGAPAVTNGGDAGASDANDNEDKRLDIDITGYNAANGNRNKFIVFRPSFCKSQGENMFCVAREIAISSRLSSSLKLKNPLLLCK